MGKKWNISQFLSLSILIFIFIATSQYGSCLPKKLSRTVKSDISDNKQTWTSFVSVKLDSHVKKLEYELEKYLDRRYLPYLRIVGSSMDFKSNDLDSGMPKKIKAMLRISTIHAYMTIYQTALVSGCVSLLNSFFKSQVDDYRLTDEEMKATIAYVNYQVRLRSYKEKTDYLVELAYTCSKYEDDNEATNAQEFEVQNLIDFLKFKTKHILMKITEARALVMEHGKKLRSKVQEAVDVFVHNEFVLEHYDDFNKKHGLESIISGYLFMSFDGEFKPKNNRKFNYKKYFSSGKSKIEESTIFGKNDHVDNFDPDIPFDILKIPTPIIELDADKVEKDRIATKKLKELFHEELISKAGMMEESGSEALASLVSHFKNMKIAKSLAEYDGDNEKTRLCRAKLLCDLGKMITAHSILRSCVLNRFMNIAKTYIGYDNGFKKANFIAPFNNLDFTLQMQQLMFAFYPAMMSQASTTMSNLDEFDLDDHKESFLAVGKKISLTSEFSELVDDVYKYVKKFTKREKVISNINAHVLKTELTRFRGLPLSKQGYFVALNDDAMINVLSLFLEPSFYEMSLLFDYVHKKVIENLLSDNLLGLLSVSNGRAIESNVILWLSAEVSAPELDEEGNHTPEYRNLLHGLTNALSLK